MKLKKIITYEELRKITSQAWLSVNDIMKRLQQVNVLLIKLKMLLKKIY